jgi:hypothetical protein
MREKLTVVLLKVMNVNLGANIFEYFQLLTTGRALNTYAILQQHWQFIGITLSTQASVWT